MTDGKEKLGLQTKVVIVIAVGAPLLGMLLDHYWTSIAALFR